MLEGKKIGVVANNASVAGGMNIVDALVNNGFLVRKIFSPEHGFRLNAEAGEIVGNDIDSTTGIPVVSLALLCVINCATTRIVLSVLPCGVCCLTIKWDAIC